MPCNVENIDGTNFVICQRGRAGSGRRCAYCQLSSTRLCDFPTGGGKTCDVPMCDFCTHRAGRTVDLCRDHRPPGIHTPRRDRDAPRWMKALYPGKCRFCFKTVRVDEKMLWFKKEKRLYCEPCGKAVLEDMKKV
jgi:hypothetical protein